MPITAPLVVIGQIAVAAFAAGLNLYLTVAIIGITSRLGWIPALPPGLQGLENAIVIASAILLYLIEFVVDKIPHVDSIWDALHTVIRPIGAAMLTALALTSAPLAIQIGAAVLAGIVALASHSTKAGLRLVLNKSPSRVRNAALSAFEDVCAAALAVVALRFPVAALALGAGAALFLFLLGPRLWRALALGARALSARMRSFFGSRGWHPTTELPPRLRALVPPLPLGQGEPRALRAAILGLPGIAAYRTGWIVFSYDQTAFLYRSLFRPRSLPMPRLDDLVVRRGLWTDAIDFNLNGRTGTIYLLKDGPAPEVALADLIEVT